MTTLTNRPNTALVVVDAQNQVMNSVHERDHILANIQHLVTKARQAGTPIIWVQDSLGGESRGTENWQIVAELEPRDDESRIDKDYPDSFESTDLERVLSDAGVGHLFVCGGQTDECIRSTLHGAITRGYDTTLVSDAHTTEDLSEWGAPTPDKVIALTNIYWGGHTAPGRTAGTVTAEDVQFG